MKKPSLEFVKADKGLRNRVIGIMMAIALAGALCIRLLNRNLDDLARSAGPPPEAAIGTLRMQFAFLTSLMAVTVVGAGAYLMAFSGKILTSSRFPPVGFRVIKDTRVVTGKPARTMGRWGMAFAVVLILAGSAFPILAWRVAQMLVVEPAG